MPVGVALVLQKKSQTVMLEYIQIIQPVVHIITNSEGTLERDWFARDICLWCLDNLIHLSAAHVPGTSNSETDEMSKSFNDDLEWSLGDLQFAKLQCKFPGICVNLLALRLNKKKKKKTKKTKKKNYKSMSHLDLSAFVEDAFFVSMN